jgi:hypothetical protein
MALYLRRQTSFKIRFIFDFLGTGIPNYLQPYRISMSSSATAIQMLFKWDRETLGQAEYSHVPHITNKIPSSTTYFRSLSLLQSGHFHRGILSPPPHPGGKHRYNRPADSILTRKDILFFGVVRLSSLSHKWHM